MLILSLSHLKFITGFGRLQMQVIELAFNDLGC